MSPPRVYLPLDLRINTTVGLDRNAFKHLTRVLRLGPGDPVILFNGEGGEYIARMQSGGNVHVETWCDVERESSLDITLVQGVSRGERMDYAIQKSVELGVTRIVPVHCNRSVVRLSGERLQRRTSHWQAVAASACEQSGRCRVPPVDTMVNLGAWLQQEASAFGIILDPGAQAALSSLSPPPGPVAILIGPEGGFEEQEMTAALKRGYTSVSLGTRVLRTETACVAALAILQSRFGDLGYNVV